MLAKYYGKIYSAEYLRELCSITSQGVSVTDITYAAENIGFRTLVANISYETLEKQVPLPCIIHWRQRHFIIVYQIEKNKVFVADPDYGLITYTKEEFVEGWQNTRYLNNQDEGLAILLEPSPTFYEKEEEMNKKSGFSFLMPYLKPYRKYISQVFIGVLISSIIQLILPFLTQAIVDRGVNYGDTNFIILILTAQLTLFLSQSFVNVIRSWLLMYTGARINLSISSDFLTKLIKLPITFFDSKISGDVLQRIQDSDRLERFLTTSPNTIFSVINMIIFMAVLLYYNTAIFLIFIIGGFLYILWVSFFMRKRAELDYRRFDEASGNSSSLLQIVNGIQEIKINGSEKRRRWGWEEMRIRLYKVSVESLKITQIQSIGAASINEMKNIIISYIAAYAVITGEMTLGMMLAVQYIIGQLNAPLLLLVQFLKEAQDAKISLNRISEINSIKAEYADEFQKEIPKKHTIVLKDLTFRYGGKQSKPVLEDLNLTIPEGKVTAIVGESGSGKTTLLKLLLKLYDPSDGKIEVGGADLNTIDTRKWRKSCGVVMQDGYIFTDTIARNITESDSEGIIDKEKLQNATAIANIDSMIEDLPGGFATRIGPVGTSGINLSGGQVQRLLIARAIYKNPKFILFDEATSALDATNEKIIMNNLSNFYKSKTVLIIAHRLSTVRDADQIIVLERGKVIEVGDHQSLIERKGSYFKLVENQLALSV
jgi:ATP-binding cassette, subfamily B, bacterial